MVRFHDTNVLEFNSSSSCKINLCSASVPITNGLEASVLYSLCCTLLFFGCQRLVF